MDPTQFKKTEAMKRRKFTDNLYLYFFSALTCSVLCCVTLCLPYLSSHVHISSLIPALLSTKLLFMIGNLIILFLVVNSRSILSSESSSTCVVYYDEYIRSKQPQIPTLEKHVGENVDMTWELRGKEWVKKATEASKEEGNLNDGDEQSLVPCSDELNKRADDFIERVNRQRRLELSLLQY